MATSGTINGTVTNKTTVFSFYVEWTATPNNAANTSTVVVKSYWKATNTGNTWDTVSARSNYVNLEQIDLTYTVSIMSEPMRDIGNRNSSKSSGDGIDQVIFCSNFEFA